MRGRGPEKRCGAGRADSKERLLSVAREAGEILEDDRDDEVEEHPICDDLVGNEEKDRRHHRATLLRREALPRVAVGVDHEVVHDAVPRFACDNTIQIGPV